MNEYIPVQCIRVGDIVYLAGAWQEVTHVDQQDNGYYDVVCGSTQRWLYRDAALKIRP